MAQSNKIPINTEIKARKEFSDREVGLTHPDLSSFIRLTDGGDIEIFASPGVGIIISARSRSISLFADEVRFNANDEGLIWNSYRFNISSYDYSQPTLVKLNKNKFNPSQNGVYHYLDMVSKIDEAERSKPVTITGSYALGTAEVMDRQNLTSDEDYSDLSVEDIAMLEVYATDYTRSHINLVISYIRQGLTFNQAHQKALREESSF